MKAQAYWIDGPWLGHLGILPRPRGGDWLDAEVQSWKAMGLEAVISLLTADEVVELDLAQEAAVCETHGIEFLSFPIPDRGVPVSRPETLEFVKGIYEFLTAGLSAAIHCRQGIGRSGLIAGCLLILSGVKPTEAIARVSKARGCAVPETVEQRQWLVGFGAILAMPMT